MLHQELPRIDSAPLDGWGRWLAPALTAAAGLTAALLLLLIGQTIAAAAVAVVGVAGAGIVLLRAPAAQAPTEPLIAGPDYSLIGAALSLHRDPCALTTGEGSVLVVNAAYRERFGGARSPLELASDEEAHKGLELAQSMAWRDGAGCVAGIATGAGISPVEVERVGSVEDLLLWRFPDPSPPDALTSAMRRLEGVTGERLANAGVMAVVVDAKGRVLATNHPFHERALAGQDLQKTRFGDLVEIGEGERMRLMSEGEAGHWLRAVHVPADLASERGAGTFLLFDSDGGEGSAGSNLQALLDMLPIGLALADRDGRFVTMNQAFRQAAGIAGSSMPLYPGDLVIKEDKPAVADAVRRNARGPAMSGDLAVRLAHQSSEPVALTIAGLRGLGDAAVLLLLKDNSEEAKLKRQVAQATKMQVVGQLAGGVAHDFNNILTAILGTCDLMLLRHTPGDSDYDDIQQIRANSNRAASLTRQLLAFSRQQTLRPQVLQLPDVVAEVSQMLKRLIGEKIRFEVRHDRDLGPVRADPTQLEQVIVNLVVNARDALMGKVESGAKPDGARLTITTRRVSSADVRAMRSEILPQGDYTGLIIEDTGSGIAPDHLAKIFEPFFTTKEQGRGTGLGLSTVYGIVKQSGGFIFADSEVGKGTRFSIYFPVHHGPAQAPVVAKPEEPSKWSGGGRILLVEDEESVRAVAERSLTRQGYEVTSAGDGEEGLEYVRLGRRFDLVVSDVVMPVMDGPAMAREIRAVAPDMPVLFMSGYAEEQLRKEIGLANMHFLPKPFSVQQICDKVAEVMGAVRG